MQTVETLNEGLKRAYTLTITAAEIDSKVDAELKRVAPQIKMPGFRPGKVPTNLVRKMHGPALTQDALNSAIQEGIQTLIAEQRLRPAIQPSVALDEGFEIGKDAEIKVSLEVLPDVPTPAIDGLKLERLTVPAGEAEVDAQVAKFAEQQKKWDDAAEDHEAATGDLVTVDFVGKTADGVAFEGGTGTDMGVEIGSGRLIPGFEDQLVGVKQGEERVLNVTFPADYPAENLAGQPATFEITATKVQTPGETVIDDTLATSLGLESLEQLKGLLKGQIEQELNGLTRTHMKRKLLDQLAEGHDFEVPPTMVEAEFDQIWQQLQHEATHEADPAAALEEMEKERDDYRKIAERRVRLGLLLSEIGQANGVEVTQVEMNRLIAQAAQQYNADDRQRFLQYIQQEPMAAAQLRAPLYEDKVVDFLFEKAEITDREVTREELQEAIESEDGFASGTHVHEHHHDHDHEGHDHEGHDHEGHDHEGHDHEGHDHEGHDHEGHDHEGHDHDHAQGDDHDHADETELKADDSAEPAPAEATAEEPVKKAATKKPAAKKAAPKAEAEAGEAAAEPKKPAKKAAAKKTEA